MHLSSYVQLLERGSATLASTYRTLAEGHAQEAEVVSAATRFASQCDEHEAALASPRKRYGDHSSGPPERLHADGLTSARSGGLGLVRDLHDAYALAGFLEIAWVVVEQVAKGLRDHELLDTAGRCRADVTAQLAWLRTQLKTASPQALIVAE